MVLRFRKSAAAMAAFGLLACYGALPGATPAAAKSRALGAIAPRDTDDLKLAPTQPAKFFTINAVMAKIDRGTKPDAPMRLASAEPGDIGSDEPALVPAAAATSAEPFGLFAFRAPEGTLWRKWRPIQAAMAREADAIAPCLDRPLACTTTHARFARMIDAVRGKAGLARLHAANETVNHSVRYVSDYGQWGQADHWSSPLETIAKGRGDCEDYAIAKYGLLRAAGMANADLKIVLVHDRAVRADHAVLAARHEGKWLILDNRHDRLSADGESRELVPLFALNDHGVSLFAAPYSAASPGKSEMRDESRIAPATSEWGGPNPREAFAGETGIGHQALAL